MPHAALFHSGKSGLVIVLGSNQSDTAFHRLYWIKLRHRDPDSPSPGAKRLPYIVCKKRFIFILCLSWITGPATWVASIRLCRSGVFSWQVYQRWRQPLDLARLSGTSL